MPAVDRLLEVMARLRDPVTGCPWDKEQDFASIAPYTIEEAYEVSDAIQRGDRAALKDELGDLLLQVVYHAQMAGERGWFVFEDVAEAIGGKMVRRHPHVFGEAAVADAAAQTDAWEAQKAAERRRRAGTERGSELDDVPLSLPAAARAQKLQKRAARVGFDWREPGPVVAKIAEEIDEVKDALAREEGLERVAAEVGDLLFAVVNWSRHLGVDAETALRDANRRFETRFRAMEALAADADTALAGLDLDRMEELWSEAKRLERVAADGERGRDGLR